MKHEFQSKKFVYEKIPPEDLEAQVRKLGLDPDEFLRITGTGSQKKWREWMSNEADIPHDAHVMLAIFTEFPKTIALAKKIADDFCTVELGRHIKFEGGRRQTI